MATELEPCGTRAAYVRHLYHGEDPCEACRAANAESGRDERAMYGRARARAHTKLRRAHPDLFASLHDAELERERRRNGGRLDPAAKERARQATYRALAREVPWDWEPLLAAELDHERAVASS